jgi:serine/threonine-protein kinase
MGAVYSGAHSRLRQPRAIKVLAPQLAVDERFVARFEREATIAAGLVHPHIVGIHDIGEADGFHYIAMQMAEGTSLRRLIEGQGALPPERAEGILAQLADALDHAHALGVVHRDLKPSNVIVGAADHVTLVDFGIARAAESPRLTGTGTMVGTPEYMAPEIVLGGSEGPSVDRYALGIVAYEMLTGRVPFEGPSIRIAHDHAYTPPPRPRSFRPDLPASAELAKQRQLAKAPAERLPSAGAFVEAIQSLTPPAQDWMASTAGRAPLPEPPSGERPDRTGALSQPPLPASWPSGPEAGVRSAAQVAARHPGREAVGLGRGQSAAERIRRRQATIPLALGTGLVAGLLGGVLSALFAALGSAALSALPISDVPGPIVDLALLTPAALTLIPLFGGEFYYANYYYPSGLTAEVAIAVALLLPVGAAIGLLIGLALRGAPAAICVAAGVTAGLLEWMAVVATLLEGVLAVQNGFERGEASFLGGLALGFGAYLALGAAAGAAYLAVRNGIARVWPVWPAAAASR